MTESGDNIVGGAFRWQRDMDSMPGWTVTVPWLTGIFLITSLFFFYFFYFFFFLITIT